MRSAFTAILLLGLAVGCQKKSVEAVAEKRGTKENPWVIGMSQSNLGEPWRVQMNGDIERAAKTHDNLKVIFKDAQNDSLTQRAQVEELVAQKIDLLIISPKETAPLTPPVAEAYQK
ncbi:MAG TPA: substrate-binding domain-containing protein, partial [Polyangiaceae bacterium]|nr:substrate-binding domain-containing protein [Polyangiaceae bacterium]